LLRPETTRDQILRDIDAIVTRDAGPLTTPVERLDAFERLLITTPPRMFPRLVAMVGAGLISYNLAARLLRGVATADEMRTVRRGLPFNPTTEMDLELWAIALRTRYDAPTRAALADRAPGELSAAFSRGALPPLLQRELETFLVRYGHRAIAEIDLGLPRWSEDPSHLLGAIANYQRLDAAALAPDAQFARGAREAEATIATLLSRVHGPRRFLACKLLRRVRALAGGGAARTWRGPRRAGDRPRMDAALPHGERARDGDGRDDVARRGRRARVRNPGRCGRSGRDDADRDGRTDRGRRLGRHGRTRRTRSALGLLRALRRVLVDRAPLRSAVEHARGFGDGLLVRLPLASSATILVA